MNYILVALKYCRCIFILIYLILCSKNLSILYWILFYLFKFMRSLSTKMAFIYNTQNTPQPTNKHVCHKLQQPQRRPRSPADWSYNRSLRSISSVFNTHRYQALLLILPWFIAWPLPVCLFFFIILVSHDLAYPTTFLDKTNIDQHLQPGNEQGIKN